MVSFNSRGSALLVSILLMMILSFMMIFLLERILPSSRTVRGIENSAQASYSARSATENILIQLRQDNPAGVVNNRVLTDLWGSGNESQVIEADTILPSPGYGNSEWDAGWNIIGPGQPTQLLLWSNIGDLSGLKIEFRVPKFGSIDTFAGQTTTTRVMADLNSEVLIGYSLTNGAKTLMMAPCPSEVQRGFNWTHVNNTNIWAFGSFCIQEIGGSNITRTLSTYITVINPNFCATTCTLKLSALRILKKASGEVIPYIEYRVRGAWALSGGAVNTCFLTYGTPGRTNGDCGPGFRLTNAIPLQSSTIISTAQVKGFKKLDFRSLEQTTTAEGLDFTVFQ